MYVKKYLFKASFFSESYLHIYLQIITPHNNYEYSTETGIRIRRLLSKHRIIYYTGSPLLYTHITGHKFGVEMLLQFNFYLARI